MSNGPRPKTREAKVVLLGDVAVGKTAIVQRFMMDTFDPSGKATRGAAFAAKQLKCTWGTLKLAIWDTAGAEQ